MRLPWVSRELYEHVARDADAWRMEYRALQDRVLNPPKLENIEIPPVIAIPREKDPISQRIEDVSGGNAKVRRHFRAMANEMKKKGMLDGDILAAIKMVSTEDEQS